MDNKAKCFLMDYELATTPHPMIPRTRMFVADREYGGPLVEVIVNFEVAICERMSRDDAIYLNFIGVPFNKQKGIGSIGLKWFLRLADKYQVDILISLSKTGDHPLNLSDLELRRWYKRHGFVFDQHRSGYRLTQGCEDPEAVTEAWDAHGS